MKPTFVTMMRVVLCALAVTLSAQAAHGAAWDIGGVYIDTYDAYLESQRLIDGTGSTGRRCRPPAHCSRPRPHPAPRAQASAKRQPTVSYAPPGGASDPLYTGKDFATRQGIEKLVASYPPKDQPQRAAEYAKLIITFNDTMPRTYGIPKNNLATALTAFVAGSYAAYTNRPFPDAAVKPLYRQMERFLLDQPRLARASMNNKAAMYQIWVGSGMLMLMAQADLSRHPNSAQQAQLHKKGGEILRALLGVEPNQVRFTANGMEFL